jgi:hypothetical protein
MSEIAERQSFADSVMWLLSQLVLDWGLDPPVSEEALKSLSMPALRSVRDVVDQVIPAFNEETLPLSAATSLNLPQEDQEIPKS